MAGLPVSDIVPLLTSTRIKSRNEAVAILSNLSIAKLKCSETELAWLVEAAFKALLAEYTNTTNAAATTARARDLSSFLRDLAEYYTKLYRGGLSLKLCGLFLTGSSAPAYITDDKEAFSPCIGDLAKIADTVLQDQRARSHLSAAQWSQCLDFFMGAIELKFRPHSTAENKDNIVTNLLSAMLTLLGDEAVEPYAPLFQRSVYTRLLGILKSAIDYASRRESAIVVISLKLVNKLMILFATEDWAFLADVAALGFNISVQFATTYLDSLSAQIALFLNLDPVHCYLTNQCLPSQSDTPNPGSDQTGPPPNVTSYTIGVLVQSLLKRIYSSPSKLSPEDIRICIEPETRDFYNLSYIACSGDKHTWLWMSGIARLVQSYYELRKTQDNSATGSSTVSLFERPRKRQKLDWGSMMHTSENALQFYNMTFNSSDEKLALVGLQLSLFHFESVGAETLDEPANRSRRASTDHSIIDFDKSTLVDLTPAPESIDAQTTALFSTLVGLSNDFSSPFWPLAACRSLLSKTDMSADASRPLLTKRLHQLLRLLMSGVKDASTYQLSCVLFHQITLSQSSEKLLLLVDTEFRIQLENLVDLAEMAGPAHADAFSFKFWQAVSVVLASTNSSRLQKLPAKIADWFAERWHDTLSHHSLRHFLKDSSREIREFINWLGGSPAENIPSVPKRSENADALYSNIRERSRLQSFIVHKEEPSISIGDCSLESHIPVSAAVIKSISETIRHGQRHGEKQPWALFFMNIADGIKSKFAGAAQSFQDDAETLLNSFVTPASQEQTCELILHSMPTASAAKLILSHTVFEDSYEHQLEGEHYGDFLDFDARSQVVGQRPEYPRILRQTQDSGSRFGCALLFKPEMSDFNFLRYLSPVEILDCVGIYSISISTKSCEFNLLLARLLVRKLGESPVSSVEYERLTKTVLTTCTFLRAIGPFIEDQELEADCLDLINHFLRCVKKKLFYNETILAAIFCMWLELARFSPSSVQLSETFDLFLSVFRLFSNNSKVLMVESLTLFFKDNAPSNSQSTLFQGIKDSFRAQTLEDSAAKCYVLASLAHQLPQFSLPVVVDLITSSQSQSSFSYARQSIQLLTASKSSTQKTLLRIFGLEIFKCLWLDGFDLLHFPVHLFGHNTQEDFMRDRYRQIVAVVTSINSSRNNSSMLDYLVSLKSSDRKSIITDSLPLIIPLAYSSNGVRNQIFQFLSRALEDDYKQIMKAKLPLILLEVFHSVDAKNELALAATLKNQKTRNMLDSKIILSSPSTTTVSPTSCVDLINALTSKFDGCFSPQLLYFLIRQLGSDNCSADEITRSLNVRKIKFVVLKSGCDISHINFANLFVELHILHSAGSLSVDFLRLLALIDFSCLKDACEIKRTQFAMKLLSILLSYRLKDKEFREIEVLAEKLIKFDADCTFFGSASPLLKVSAKKILNEETAGQICDLAALLLDASFSKILEYHEDATFRVISNFFDTVKEREHLKPNTNLTRVLVNTDLSETTSPQFQLWISEYLAIHYVSGTTNEDMKSLIISKKPFDSEKSNFEKTIGSLDFFIDALMRKSLQATYEECAFIETALGAILLESLRHTTSFIDSHSFEVRVKPYILPIDLKSFLLLNSDENNLCLDVQNAAQLVLASYSDVQKWTCDLLLYILARLAESSTHAQVLASCILKMPDIAREMVPPFVCFYVGLAGEKGRKLVQDVISSFWRNFKKPYCNQSIEVITNLALLIRLGAMKDNEEFRLLYNSLDLEALMLIAAESTSPKSALLFFDDYVIRNGEMTNWQSHSSVLSKLYVSLGEADLLDGVPNNFTLSESLGLKYDFVHPSERARYSSGLLDAKLILDQYSAPEGVVHSLSSDGMLGVSKLLDESCSEKKSYEWCWKLNSWEMPPPTRSSEKHDVIYSYLKQIRDNPTELETIYDTTMRRLLSDASDTTTGLQKEDVLRVETRLQTLAIVQTCNQILSTESGFENEITSFRKQTYWLKDAELSTYEDLLTSRRVAYALLKSTSDSRPRSISVEATSSLNPKFAIITEIARYNDLLRNERSMQKMINSCILLEQFVKKADFGDSHLTESAKKLASYYAAQTLWAEGKTTQSVRLLADLDRRGSIDVPFSDLSVSNQLIKAQMAIWLAESRLALGSDILADIVDPMKETMNKILNLDQCSLIYQLLAQFCEHQFKSQELRERITELEDRVNGRRAEIEDIKSHYGKTSVSVAEKKSVQKYYARLKAQAASESRELESLTDIRSRFGRDAATYYLKAISIKDVEDEDLDKFFSLFFELAGDEDFQSGISRDFEKLASYKSLSWCTQLLSRVSDESTPFQDSIKNAVYKICRDHPYHSLYFLISLIYHEPVAEESFNSSMVKRVNGAKSINAQLSNFDEKYTFKILLPIERFCRESVSLAEVKAGKGRTLHLDKLKIGKYWTSELPAIPPPTLYIPVSRNGYVGIPVMQHLGHQISVAPSGLSLPKIVKFHLSNGNEHTILYKHGTDDLRQDSIMEQVFEKVNKFLTKDKETRVRQLRVRTYRAVPLGPKAGLIEFVPNSKALIELIKPFHQKSDKMRTEKARELMKSCQTEGFDERLRVYRDIEKKIQPVLHRYFLNHFVTPETWFESRQTYTRGVAATSIVGHILGLGDRHCNNILVDEDTGEPIHIDLGVAFDQGKRLPIPETVPFRLTRDVVDGFGFMGTSGPFSIACEHTYRVLRSNEEHILAILDVLRWDPLYSWSISPIRKMKVQNENAGLMEIEVKQDGSEAGTAILTVIEKLHARGLSVEATVRDLIREAKSEENLAVIYCGWCPFF